MGVVPGPVGEDEPGLGPAGAAPPVGGVMPLGVVGGRGIRSLPAPIRAWLPPVTPGCPQVDESGLEYPDKGARLGGDSPMVERS